MSNFKSSDIEIAPLRTLDDFLLKSARFQIPDFKHTDKWGNRIVKNLLYYQTNYILFYVIMFVIIGVIHPKEVASGAVTCALIAILYLGFTNQINSLEHFRNEYRNVTIVIVVLALYFVYYMLNTVLVLMVALFSPASVIFIHASLRLRNVKNRIANQVEVLELRVTPMGLLLKRLGLQSDTPKISPAKKIVSEISENLKF